MAYDPRKNFWVRVQDDDVFGPEFGRITDGQRWTFVVILTFASKSPISGSVRHSNGDPVTALDIAARCSPETDVDGAIDYFIATARLKRSSGGVLQLPDWNRYFGPKDKTGAERKKKERAGGANGKN